MLARDYARSVALLTLLLLAPLARAQQPAAPYYSVQIMGLSSEKYALDELKALADQPYARAELRDNYWLVRLGAFPTPEDARTQRDAYREKGLTTARVVKVSRPVDWLLADGTQLAAAGGAAADAAPAEAPAPARKKKKTDAAPTPVAEAATVAAAPAAAPAAEPAMAELPPIKLDNAGGATDWNSTIVSLEQLGYKDGISLEGSTGSRDLFFPLPAGVNAQRAELILDLTFGELLIPESSLQVSVNGSVRTAVRRGTAVTQRLEVPLTARDLEHDFARVGIEWTLYLDRDICFSRKLSGAYVRLSAGSGLAVVSSDAVPHTVLAGWSLLPRDVQIAARLSELTPGEFQALLNLSTLLHREGHEVTYQALTDDRPPTAHIVLAPAERYVRGGSDALEGMANLRLVRSTVEHNKVKEERAFILVDSTRPLPASAILRTPWRGITGARLVDSAVAAEWPQPREADDVVRLSSLGFTDSERQFSYSAEWPIALPYGPLGNAQRPARASLEVYGPMLTDIRGPTIVSAFYNDRLVYSTALKGKGEKEVLEFELPRVQLRARNNLRVIAQRDEIGDICKLSQAAFPLSVSPQSTIETKPLNERPSTFAELVPHQRVLELYVAKDALSAADKVVPLLVTLGDHFWPDVPPPELRLFDPGEGVKPTGPFFVVGNAKWDPQAWVHFDEGRVRVRSNATGESAMLLDFARDTSTSVLQMVEAASQGGAWLKTTGGYANVPSRTTLFEDENVAFLGPRGVQMALRVGSAKDYRVDYPEAKGWFNATGHWRTVLFVVAWLLVAALLVYLWSKTRRHRGE